MSELAALYARYKGLALAVGAGFLLDDGADLSGETLRLASDAGRAREADDNRATRAVHEAALALHDLAGAGAAVGTDAHAELLVTVRATHRRLRSEIWDEVAHQYAPCGAHPHRHTEEHDHV